TVGAPGAGSVNLKTGDVIADGSTLYRYEGADTVNFSLTDSAITGDPTDFKVIGGQNGATYEFVGATGSVVVLGSTNYDDSSVWNLKADAKGRSKEAEALVQQLDDFIDQAVNHLQASSDRFDSLLAGILEAQNDRAVNIVSTFKALDGEGFPRYINLQ